VAKKLETLGYTFTGADSEALALAHDKQRVKAILDRASIPTPAWQICDSPDAGSWKIFPAIVKPQNEHCSAGITPESVIMNQPDLKNRISFILDKYSQPALVEDFIDGREFHVAVWGNQNFNRTPRGGNGFSSFGSINDRLCTYEAKFIPGSSTMKKSNAPAAPLSADEKSDGKGLPRRLPCDGVPGLRPHGHQASGQYFLCTGCQSQRWTSALMPAWSCAAEEAGISYARMGSPYCANGRPQTPDPGENVRE